MPKRHGFSCERGRAATASRRRCSSARGAPARAAATATCRRATACRSRCARASPTPSSTTATARSASRCTSASGRRRAAATPAPRISRAPRSSRRSMPRAAIARHTAEDDCAGLPDAGAARARAARPRSLPSLGALHGGRGRAREALRGGGLRGVEEDPQLRGRDSLGAADAVRVRQQPRLRRAASRARATGFRAR